MKASREAIVTAHKEIDYECSGYPDNESCLAMTEKAMNAAYAIDVASLEARIRELEETCTRLRTNSRSGWIGDEGAKNKIDQLQAENERLKEELRRNHVED